MLTIELSWATLLWALGVFGLLALIVSAVACLHIAADFWHNRPLHASDWAYVSSLVKPPFRPLAWLAAKVCHARAGGLVGRVLLRLYQWTG